MILGCVEVDVVRDLDRQVHRHVRDGEHGVVGDIITDEFDDGGTHFVPATTTLRHERVERRLGEHDVVLEDPAQVEDRVADADADAGGFAVLGGEDAVGGEVVDAEERAPGCR